MSAMASVRSIPVQKARSPAPVISTTRTSSFSRSCAHREISSARIVELKEFIAAGRFKVTVATPSATDSRSVSKSATTVILER